MFSGTIPGPLRSMIRESAATWPKGADIWIGCSGNFTIERTLADMGFRLHGNDVSIYTCALGAYLTDTPIDLTLNPDSEDELGWIADYLDGGAGTVATLMLATRFLADVGRPGGYFERNVAAYRDQFPVIHARTVERVKGVTLRLASYHPKDVREYLDQDVPEDGIVVSFPPFYKGGYEKLYEAMDRHFVWPKPEYDMLDLDDVVAVLDKIADRPTWILATNHEDTSRAEHLRGYIQPALKAAPFWVYASDAHARVVTAAQKVEPVFLPRFGPGDEITPESKIDLRALTPGQFESMRLLYMNADIKAFSTDVTAFAVCIDGKMVGVFAYGKWTSPSELLLISDFVVSGTTYPRLSKLVAAAAVSREARMAVERSWARRALTAQTAVFSNNPVSMKYRGVWTVRRREDLPAAEKFRYKITYESGMGRWSLNEALQTWVQKHGKRQETAPSR